jgi:2-oxoglutarate ferredoxin oxidoreductase subunit beta
MKPSIVSIGNGVSQEDLWIHDEKDYLKATLLSRFPDLQKNDTGLPRPLGILYATERATYEDLLHQQKEMAVKKSGTRDLMKLFMGNNYWEIT